MEADGAAVVYVSDTAPFDKILFEHKFFPTQPAPPSRQEAAYLALLRSGVIELCAGADLVVYDTMCSPEEYEARPHWGHSTAEHALELCQEAGAATLALFHYSPTATDDDLDRKVAGLIPGAPVKVVASREGDAITL